MLHTYIQSRNIVNIFFPYYHLTLLLLLLMVVNRSLIIIHMLYNRNRRVVQNPQTFMCVYGGDDDRFSYFVEIVGTNQI